MIFSLDVRRARKGDCLLLHLGSEENPGLVLIDGGPRGVYAPHLKPRLEQIRAARGLQKGEPLDVDLLMVSHVDDDHIQGILDLTKEMLEAQAAGRSLPLRVLSLWHNCFDDIIGNDPEELTASIRTQFGAASTAGRLPDDAIVEVDDEDLGDAMVTASLKVLASIEQGSRLRGVAGRLQFPANPEFDGRIIIAQEGGGAIDVVPRLTFTVVGPMLPEIEKLRRKHEAWLIGFKGKGKSAHEALAAYVDKSVSNLASIVVLAEAGGKRMLFTGDARGDKILEGLELAGVLKKGGTIHIELLKVPHHGSANNLDDDFFERITADHYVFSGNGEHGNPERAALEMLLKARGDADYRIHLTYPIEDIDATRQEDWQKEQAKERKRKKKNVRPDWSPQLHGLNAFLAENPHLARKLSIVGEDKPHLIDLGDSLKEAWPSLLA